MRNKSKEFIDKLNEENKLNEVLDKTFNSGGHDYNEDELTHDQKENQKVKEGKDEAIFGSFNRGVAEMRKA